MKLVHEEEYDLTNDPPLVVIRGLSLSRSDVNWSENIIAIIDSGADLSSVPAYLIDPVLTSIPTESVTVIDWDGLDRRVTAVRLDYKIGDCEKRDTLFVISNGRETLVGRDILNAFHITLDGKPCSAQKPTISWSE